MRITLDLGEDVILTAKVLAAGTKRSVGKVISEVFWRGMHAGETPAVGPRRRGGVAAGFEVLPAGGRVVTAAFVRELRDGTKA